MNKSVILLLEILARIFISRNENNMAEYIALAAALLESGQEVNKELQNLVAELEGLAATNSEPTEADFNRIAARRHELVSQLHETMREISDNVLTHDVNNV